ncbi:MAG: methyltransferase domain-containing protein [Candidatus Dojkabacteria bacterium]|nr:MAG: methyltransferase domain-containing protein [Candidatus Dojkabacteria bacterium]
MSKELIALLIMIPFYGLALFMIGRTLIVAFSFRDPVPFVPVEKKLLKKAVQLLEIKPGDRVIDIGSGSGRFLITAAKQFPEAQFTGMDINRALIFWSNCSSKINRLRNIKFMKKDVREADFSQYNKVYLYMTTGFVADMMERLVNELPSGAIVVSVAFGFGKKFEAENSVEVYEVGTKRNDKVSVWRKK